MRNTGSNPAEFEEPSASECRCEMLRHVLEPHSFRVLVAINSLKDLTLQGELSQTLPIGAGTQGQAPRTIARPGKRPKLKPKSDQFWQLTGAEGLWPVVEVELGERRPFQLIMENVFLEASDEPF